MTAMNAEVQPDSITLTMDTLVSTRDSEGLHPAYFNQKFQYIASEKSIVCGTGSFLIIREAFKLSREILAENVVVLAQLLKQALQKQYEELHNKYGHAVVYIFGFDHELKTHAYAIRIQNKFDFDEIAGADHPKVIIKPGSSQNISVWKKFEQSDNYKKPFVQLMRFQKKTDDALDPLNSSKIGIGGQNEMISLAVVPGITDPIAVVQMIDTFEDYGDTYDDCLTRVHQTK